MGQPLLFLQHTPFETPALVGELWAARGGQAKTVFSPEQALPDPRGFSGVVVLGGPQSVYEEEGQAWMRAELDLTRLCLQAGIPFLGLCLGSQVLARAAGGRVFKHSAKEIGWGRVQLTPAGGQDALFKGIPADFNTFHWHGDSFTLPDGAVLLAGNAVTPHQAFRLGQRAWGLQFHPEVGEGDILRWCEGFSGDAGALKALSQEELLGPVKGMRTELGPVLERFLSFC